MILADKNAAVLVQGITGTIGKVATKLMLEYGTRVVAGVTPGKGGQEIEGIPVYNSVQEALNHHPEINISTVSVPNFAAKDAVFEAISNGIKLINLITEGIAISDSAKMIRYANLNNARIIGPSSIGIISPGECRLGVIGGSKENVDKIYKKGTIGVISKSGGMTNESAWIVRQAGLGQSTVVGIGGDIILGTTFADLLLLFEKDKQTKGVVIFGEPGGNYENQIADLIKEKKFTKPVAAFIAGKFTEKMPSGMKFGHAGVLLEGQSTTPQYKIKLLKEAGVLIADRHDQIGELIKSVV